MSQKVAVLIIILAALGLAFGVPAWGGEKSPREILNYIDDLYRGESSRGVMTMHIVTKHWERTLKMRFWTEGKDRTLVRILAPAKERGTATLRVGADIWNYLPKTNRTIKLPSSMMSASWMGSHITNDDLVKESRMTEDYTFETTFEGERDGREITEITCLPKPEAPVVWGRVVEIVRAADYQPLEARYYDEDLDLARTMVFSDIRQVDDRRIPTTLTVLPADKPDEKTVVAYEEIEYNVDLPPSTFSLRALKR